MRLLWAVGMLHISTALGNRRTLQPKRCVHPPIPSSHEEWWSKRNAITLLMHKSTLLQSLGLRGCPFELI
jgi:hypothetical protein